MPNPSLENCSKLLFAIFAFSILKVVTFGQNATAGEDLIVTDIRTTSDSELEISFSETGDGFAEFKIETSVDLSNSASAWTLVGGATFELLEQHNYRALVPITPGESRFFRIS